MRDKRYMVGVSTSEPSIAVSGGGGGAGCIAMLCPYTGAVQSSLQVASGGGGDSSKTGGLGVSTVSTFPACFSASLKSNSTLAIGFASNKNKKDDAYGILLTLRASTLPPILHWKCRLPEAQMSAGLVTSPCGRYIVGGSSSGALYVWKSIGTSTTPTSSEVGGAGAPLLKSIKAHYRSVIVLTWSLCGRYLITGGADGLIHVFSILDLVDATTDSNAAAVQPIRTWTQHHLSITALVALDSGRFASSSQDGQVAVMEIFSGLVVATIQFPHPITTLAESKNRLFCGSSNRTIHIIDLDDYALHKTAQLGAVSRRSQQLGGGGLASSSSSNKEDDSSTPSYLVELHGHDRAITALAVLPEDDLLLSGDEMGTLRVWDLQARSCVRVIQPWLSSSSSAANKKHSPATAPSCPVTSICVLLLQNDSEGAEATGMFTSAATNTTTSNRHKNAVLVAALQKFVQPAINSGQMAMPFSRPTRDSSVGKRSAEAQVSTFSYAAALSKRRRLQQQQQGDRTGVTAPSTNATRKEKDDTTTTTSSDNTAPAEQIAKLQKELVAAQAVIQRWEAVNNKLMARLQQQQQQA